MKQVKMINSNNEIYAFDEKEMIEIFIWAFGYADLKNKRLLPIDIDSTVENATLYKKLRLLLKDDIEVIQRIKDYR